MGRTFEVQPCFLFLEDGCRLTKGQGISHKKEVLCAFYSSNSEDIDDVTYCY